MGLFSVTTVKNDISKAVTRNEIRIFRESRSLKPHIAHMFRGNASVELISSLDIEVKSLKCQQQLFIVGVCAKLKMMVF